MPWSINPGSAGSRRSPAWRYTSPAQAQGVQAEEGWGNVGVSGLSKSSGSDHTAGKEPHGSFSSGRQAVARAAVALVRRVSVGSANTMFGSGVLQERGLGLPRAGRPVPTPHEAALRSAQRTRAELREGDWALIQNVSVGHR